jgi:hypothetical protein
LARRLLSDAGVMSASSIDRQFARFIKRHAGRCGTVTVERPEQLTDGLTLTVSCSCGVKSEWQVIPPPPVEADGNGVQRLTA